MRRPAPGPHLLPAAALVLAVLLGCGGKGPDAGSTVVTPPPPVLPTFQCSDSPVMADEVALKCGPPLSGGVREIDVMIGVPTQSTDIEGFAIDLLFDPALLQYVAGSARPGDMLSLDGNSLLLDTQVVGGTPSRLVLGISRTGGVPGVTGTAGYGQILSFKMRAVPGVLFDPDPSHLLFDHDRSEAFDSSVPAQPILSISFRDQILLSFQ
jgi:hypothetical protein